MKISKRQSEQNAKNEYKELIGYANLYGRVYGGVYVGVKVCVSTRKEGV